MWEFSFLFLYVFCSSLQYMFNPLGIERRPKSVWGGIYWLNHCLTGFKPSNWSWMHGQGLLVLPGPSCFSFFLPLPPGVATHHFLLDSWLAQLLIIIYHLPALCQDYSSTHSLPNRCGNRHRQQLLESPHVSELLSNVNKTFLRLAVLAQNLNSPI